MGRISTTKKIVVEEFAAQRPWIDKLIVPINAFFEQVYFTLVRGVTVRDNLKAQTIDYTLPVDYDYTVALKIAWQLNEAPSTVILAYVREKAPQPALIGAHAMEWNFNNGTLELWFSGLSNAKAYTIRIVGIV